MLLCIEGEQGCGKTTLAYTAPRKVVGFAFDMGIERALMGAMHQKYFAEVSILIKPYDYTATATAGWADHDITIYELPQPLQLDGIEVKGAHELWSYFIQLAVLAFRDEAVRTIVLDTATIARRVKADGYLQVLQEADPSKHRERLIQIEYGSTNDAIRSIYTTAAGTKKNLIATHHLKDERKETVDSKGSIVNALTGNRVLEGLDQTYRYMDVVLRNRQGSGDALVTTEFRKCGYNLSLSGMELPNPTWDGVVQLIEDTLGGTMKLERTNGT